ncbi:hypothetical protein BJ508DRAFT_328949 [Ascobolus immersus RN42]|uniref:Uncharacterized protein n=1 Tax=Ascobolus immersus RN42 TaxID=1160509 RepID=A0A3N4HY59_ASCIM|nr:hypothetical protein BJ508DRAFT_328949 [Ascobolus immersus RN42]
MDDEDTTMLDAQVGRITDSQLKRFRRATWTLDVLYRRGGPQPTDNDNGDNGGDEEEDEATEDQEQPSKIGGQDLLKAFTTLCARSNKVVAAITSEKIAAFAEDVNEEELVDADHEGEAQGSGAPEVEGTSYLVTQNPREKESLVEADGSFFWVGNTGIRLTNVRSDIKLRPPSDSSSLAEHMRLVVRYGTVVRKARTEAGNVTAKTESFSIYILRACLPKTCIRVEYHCNAAKGSKISQSLVQDDKFSRSLPVDYSQFLFPYELFDGMVIFSDKSKCTKFRTCQLEYLEHIHDNRLPAPLRLSKYELTEEAEMVLVRIGSTLGIDFSPTDSSSIFNCTCSIIQVYITGILALQKAITGDKSPSKGLWKSLWHDQKEMDKGLRDALKVLAAAGGYLVTLSHSTFFEQFLQDIFHDPIREKGCRKWLFLISAPFFAMTVLCQRAVLEKVEHADVLILETVFRKRDHSMEPLSDFLQAIDDESRLSELDRNRLETWMGNATKFVGAIHCETSLLLLCITAKEYPSLLPEPMLAIIRKLNPRFLGVSKLSCPICNMVISVAEEILGIEICRSGAHNSYSKCDLPEWVPEAVARRILGKLEATCLPWLVGQAKLLVPKAEGQTRGSESPEPREFEGILAMQIAGEKARTAPAEDDEDNTDAEILNED